MEILKVFDLSSPIKVDGADVNKVELERFQAKHMLHLSGTMKWGDVMLILEKSSNLLGAEIDMLEMDDVHEIGIFIGELLIPDDIEGQKVKLKFPIKNSKGDEITEISMAKPKGKHLRNMPMMPKFEDNLRLAAELSLISYKTLLELDCRDAVNVVNTLGK